MLGDLRTCSLLSTALEPPGPFPCEPSKCSAAGLGWLAALRPQDLLTKKGNDWRLTDNVQGVSCPYTLAFMAFLCFLPGLAWDNQLL